MSKVYSDDIVTVSLRIRPLVFHNLSSATCLQVISKEPPVLLLLDKSQPYHFDNIFTEENDQESVYNNTVKPLVENVKAGYNSTVFAYGQTGTGKTYTIGTNPDITQLSDMGLISRALDDFFNHTKEDQEIEIHISFIEIYNEKVFDLLGADNSTGPLPVKGFTVQGYNQERVYSTFDAQTFLKAGGKKRHTGETKQNPKSSRSHAIFTIYCRVKHSDHESFAKLNLVDLAGSESVRKTGCQGSSFHEGININKGLLCLGQVMTALSMNSGHIPYRQSIITTILQDSLNKKNFVSLIACISTNNEDTSETQQTLEFAARVKKIKNRPEVNQIILKFKNDNPALFVAPPGRGLTPSKRLIANSYETPFKKQRSFLPSIQEPSQTSNASGFDSPKSLSSLSAISVLSNDSNIHQNQNLSPVIQKYMNVMENSLVNKIEDMITKTLKRPTRQSLAKNQNKENCTTPSFSWDKVAKVVRSELLQYTGRISRATSSPIEDYCTEDSSHNHFNRSRELTCRQILKDDRGLDSPMVDNGIKEDDEDFKIPAIPKLKNHKRVYEKRRSSMRLQTKASGLIENGELQKPDILDSPKSFENDIFKMPNRIRQKKQKVVYEKRRSSMRLQAKSVNITTENQKVQQRDVIQSPQSKNMDNKDTEKCVTSPFAVKANKKNHQKSTTTKDNKSNKTNTSAMKNWSNKVLDILNNGHAKDLMKLQTVGIKRAQKILLYRKFNGEFDSISDISTIFVGNNYDKFLTENFLK